MVVKRAFQSAYSFVWMRFGCVGKMTDRTTLTHGILYNRTNKDEKKESTS